MRRSVMTTLGEGLAAVAAVAAMPKWKLSLDEATAKANEKRAHAMLATARADQDPHRAAKPTGVRMKDSRSSVQDIYSDGSIRNLWKRKDGLSGRQFRKLRKQVNRNLRAQAKAKAE